MASPALVGRLSLKLQGLHLCPNQQKRGNGIFEPVLDIDHKGSIGQLTVLILAFNPMGAHCDFEI